LLVSILKDAQGHHRFGKKDNIPQRHCGNFRGCTVRNKVQRAELLLIRDINI